jgi:DNA-binding PadR family transcriptional regulator
VSTQQYSRTLAADEWLLRMLAASPASGFEISRRLQGVPRSRPGSARDIYRSLRRLESMGLIAGEWRPMPGRRLDVRQYCVTAGGLKTLVAGKDADRQITALSPVMMLMVLAVLGRPTASEGAAQLRPSRLTIIVSPIIHVSAQELRQMSIDVNRLFGSAGITIDWLFEPPLSTPPSFSSIGSISGFVIHATLALSLSNRPAVGRDEIVLGITRSSDTRTGDIVLFYDHIAESASQTQKDVSGILALVLAHEIGHVLLPSPAHADAGIMQAPWDRQSLDRAADRGLLFTASQGELMRKRLVLCCEIARRN